MLYRFLTEQGALTCNPAPSVLPPKLPRTKADAAADADLARFMNTLPNTANGRRCRLFFRLPLETGMRVTEACSVRVDDIDLAQGTLYVRRGKGTKDRIVPLIEETTEAIRGCLAGARANPGNSSQRTRGRFGRPSISTRKTQG